MQHIMPNKSLYVRQEIELQQLMTTYQMEIWTSKML